MSKIKTSVHAERAIRFAHAVITSKDQVSKAEFALSSVKQGQYEVLKSAIGEGEPITETIWNEQWDAPFRKVLTDAEYDTKSNAPMLNRFKLFAILVTHEAQFPRGTTKTGQPRALYAYVDENRAALAKAGLYTPSNSGNSASNRTATGKGGKAAVEVAPEKVTRRTAAMVLLGTQETADVEFVMELITAANLPKLRAIAALLSK